MTDEEIQKYFDMSWATHGDRVVRFARIIEYKVKEEAEQMSTNIEQQSFHEAVYTDPEMSPELKIYWLKKCADKQEAAHSFLARCYHEQEQKIQHLERRLTELAERLGEY